MSLLTNVEVVMLSIAKGRKDSNQVNKGCDIQSVFRHAISCCSKRYRERTSSASILSVEITIAISLE